MPENRPIFTVQTPPKFSTTKKTPREKHHLFQGLDVSFLRRSACLIGTINDKRTGQVRYFKLHTPGKETTYLHTWQNQNQVTWKNQVELLMGHLHEIYKVGDGDVPTMFTRE